MSKPTNSLEILPCLDSPSMANARRQELDVSRRLAASLGRSAIEAVERGYYLDLDGQRVDLSHLVEAAAAGKRSIAPDDPLPRQENGSFPKTRIQVSNETTMGASRRLVDEDLRPLALNFANGIHPGGGFLGGARAQEEVLCRSSALYQTLIGDPMYESHKMRPLPDSTEWSIYSPVVPVFRMDDGTNLPHPWLLSIITCAAPYAPRIGQPASGDLMKQRIHRVLEIAMSFGHTEMVLGAWGCGAFANDPHRTAEDFRQALEGDFAGVFSEVAFAVTDWSPDRRFLGPFRDVFAVDKQWMTDAVHIESRDYWFKVVEMLQQNWALIDQLPDGSCKVFFVHDNSGVFDEMEFASNDEATAALARNGFSSYADDSKVQEFICSPKPPFHRDVHRNGPIYSSGQFWQ
jgi:uncharacterized protein (TIGR02452 family)